MGSSKLDDIVTLWRRKCGSRLMPSRADFDVLDLRPWLGHISLCDVIPAEATAASAPADEVRFRLRLQGTHLVDAHAADYTGRFLDEAFPRDHLEPLLQPLRRCVVTRRPVTVVREGRDLRGRFRRIHRAALPLSPDGQTAHMVLLAEYTEIPEPDLRGLKHAGLSTLLPMTAWARRTGR